MIPVAVRCYTVYKGMLKKYINANRNKQTVKLCMENTFLEKS
jgi:hypothetical protein